MSDARLKQRITDLANAMSAGLHEREEHAAVILLAALSGQNIFLLGLPGTAKSLLARRLASVFEGVGPCFEYLMHRFSTPEEIFGPVSIAELKKDNYKRKTEGFLPKAHFAFLDEIWKSSPGILNTLLTIINEKIFRNGTETKPVPLKALIAASNETPPENQGLDALYDRLIVRLYVSPVEGADNFNQMLTEKPADPNAKCELPIRDHEINEWRKKIQAVELSRETKDIIKVIRGELSKLGKKPEEKVYVSDRRWQQAAILLKAAAFFCDRKSTNLADTMLLQHCLWTTEDNREKVMAIVEKAVKDNGFKSEINIANLSKDKESLEKDIKSDFYHTEDIYEIYDNIIEKESFYKITVYYGNGFYHEDISKYELYVPCKNRGEFHPLDEAGNEADAFTCTFESDGCYSVTSGRYDLYKSKNRNSKSKASVRVVAEISVRKGDRKSVSPTSRKNFENEVGKIAMRFGKVISEIEGKRASLAKEISTPFVSKEKQGVALDGIEKQLTELRSEQADYARLRAMIDGE